MSAKQSNPQGPHTNRLLEDMKKESASQKSGTNRLIDAIKKESASQDPLRPSASQDSYGSKVLDAFNKAAAARNSLPEQVHASNALKTRPAPTESVNASKVPQSMVSPTDRVNTAIKKLSVAAIDLNTASDELGEAIAVLDAALKKLNLGISAWLQLSGNEDPYGGDWWSRDIGYTKIRDRWGIALRGRKGNCNNPQFDQSEEWLFNEGPRWLRIVAVGKIPELLEALLKQAEDTTKKIKGKTAEAQQIGAAIARALEAEFQPVGQDSEVPHA